MNIGESLEISLKVILTGNNNEGIRSTANRLKLSIGQTNGRIKTSKSVLYPSVIKSLTNGIGHGASDYILEKRFTENAFRLIDVCWNETFILTGIMLNQCMITSTDCRKHYQVKLDPHNALQFKSQEMSNFFPDFFLKKLIYSGDPTS